MTATKYVCLNSDSSYLFGGPPIRCSIVFISKPSFQPSFVYCRTSIFRSKTIWLCEPFRDSPFFKLPFTSRIVFALCRLRMSRGLSLVFESLTLDATTLNSTYSLKPTTDRLPSSMPGRSGILSALASMLNYNDPKEISKHMFSEMLRPRAHSVFVVSLETYALRSPLGRCS